MRACLAVGTAVVVAVAVAIRAWHLADVPRLTDETAEVLRAVSIVDDHVYPLSNVDPYIGPHVNYLVAGLFALFGPDPWLPRMVSLACGVLTVLAAERLASAIAQPTDEGHGAAPDPIDSAAGVWAARVGGLVAAVLVAVNPLHVVVNSHVAWSHATTPLFTTAGLWALYLGVERRRGAAVAWAGLLFGLAVATHPTAVFVVAGAGVYALLRGHHLLRTPWPWIAVGLLVLVNAPLLVFNAITSGSSVTNGLSVIRDYGHGREGTVGLASYARSLGRHGQLLEQMLAGPLDLRPPTLEAAVDPLLLLYAGVSLVALLTLPRRAWSLLVLPFVGLLCGMAYLNTTKYEPVTDGRYLAPLVPIVAAAVGCLTSGLLRRARQLTLRVAVGVIALTFVVAPAVHALDYERRFAEAEPGNVEMLAEARRAAAAARPGEVIVVDSNRPTSEHGTPPKLLACEFLSVGYRLEEMIPRPSSGGYLARFKTVGARPEPDEISTCKLVKE